MMSSLHRLIPFSPLFCNYQFRRLDSIQSLCSYAHSLAGWRLGTRLDSTTLLRRVFCVLLLPLAPDHPENTASIVKEACLIVRCLAVDVLLLHTYASREYVTESLPSN
jgi:hypothetical protein